MHQVIARLENDMGRHKKYSDDEKRQYLEQYDKSRGGNLTTYSGLVGEQFATRVNMLAHLIRGAHEYSLGRYKERLLAKLISESIPSKYSVGTGFVLFPTEKTF